MRNSKNFKTDFFNIRIHFNQIISDPKFAIVVSKKISKKAVIRNQIRRRIYEIVRNNFDFDKKCHIIINVVNKNVCESDSNEMKKQLLNVFNQIR